MDFWFRSDAATPTIRNPVLDGGSGVDTAGFALGGLFFTRRDYDPMHPEPLVFS